MMRHRAPWVVTLVLVASACSVIPSSPSPLPTDYVPIVAPEAAGPQGYLSPDGFSQAQRMTVRVRNVGCEELRTGTGFAINAHTLVTNRHVIENTRKLQVTTYDGHSVDVTAVSAASVADLAIVTIEEAMDAAPVLAQEDPGEGDEISVVGYPGGRQLTTVTGIVIGPAVDPLGTALGDVLATTAPVEPGSSGSPVLNEAGEVVGVIYAKNDSEQSFMVPVSMLRALLHDESLLVEQQQTCDAA